jgi:hypothetical protein
LASIAQDLAITPTPRLALLPIDSTLPAAGPRPWLTGGDQCKAAVASALDGLANTLIQSGRLVDAAQKDRLQREHDG